MADRSDSTRKTLEPMTMFGFCRGTMNTCSNPCKDDYRGLAYNTNAFESSRHVPKLGSIDRQLPLPKSWMIKRPFRSTVLYGQRLDPGVGLVPSVQ